MQQGSSLFGGRQTRCQAEVRSLGVSKSGPTLQQQLSAHKEVPPHYWNSQHRLPQPPCHFRSNQNSAYRGPQQRRDEASPEHPHTSTFNSRMLPLVTKAATPLSPKHSNAPKISFSYG